MYSYVLTFRSDSVINDCKILIKHVETEYGDVSAITYLRIVKQSTIIKGDAKRIIISVKSL